MYLEITAVLELAIILLNSFLFMLLRKRHVPASEQTANVQSKRVTAIAKVVAAGLMANLFNHLKHSIKCTLQQNIAIDRSNSKKTEVM